ncbi:M10 family metallopeptidase C-terminal domain-containing protein [Sphingomonas caseinilyticus]|nr:M10 family metallopeptidase C-terminal domain-containing protein [Sphingomonas caseinilyticus]
MLDVQRSEFDFSADDLDASLDPFAGGTAYDNPIWTPQQIAAHLNRTQTGWGVGVNGTPGSDADLTTINFGFHNSLTDLENNGYVYELGGTYYGFAEYFNFATFTTAQRDAAREAIQYWDDVVAVSFVETSADDADINFGGLASAPQTQAYARLPADIVLSLANPPAVLNHVNPQVREIGGDVWVSASQPSNFQFDEGLYGLNTLVHEIGHALGLSHPGAYNFGPGFAVTYANGAEYAQDIRNYTIMSYWNPRDVGIQDHDYNMGTIAYGATPMIHDIYAAQQMYGADMTTRTGDTTYGFNATADTAGRDAFNFDLTPAPVMAIWDAGGNDTLDASGYATNQVIDLTPGSMSSIGGVTLENAPTLAEVNANRAAAGYPPLSQVNYDIRMANLAANPDAGLLVDNVGIAYGVTIENAVGGSGNDLIIGNDASNRLYGNAGNDTISGGAGVDYMTGGAGNDTFIADINGALVPTKRGTLSLDVIMDFETGDKIDLSAIDANLSKSGDQAFSFIGSAANKGVGQLSYKVFESINGAEKALGMDIDGIDGPGAAGPVTVVFGNVDGGAVDFAIALLNKRGVTAADFVDTSVPTFEASSSTAIEGGGMMKSQKMHASDFLF